MFNNKKKYDNQIENRINDLKLFHKQEILALENEIEKLKTFFEENGFNVSLHIQDNVQCAELEKWTFGGVDMIIWLNPFTPEEFKSYVNDFDIDQYQGFVYFVEANEDISNLYIIADALVTDYSSVFFDYAILKRPIYFYMYDLIHYRDELRGFYLDIYHDLPGDIIEDENQLLEEIKKGYDYQRLDKFNQRFNNHEDGKASKRVVDIVFK